MGRRTDLAERVEVLGRHDQIHHLGQTRARHDPSEVVDRVAEAEEDRVALVGDPATLQDLTLRSSLCRLDLEEPLRGPVLGGGGADSLGGLKLGDGRADPCVGADVGDGHAQDLVAHEGERRRDAGHEVVGDRAPMEVQGIHPEGRDPLAQALFHHARDQRSDLARPIARLGELCLHGEELDRHDHVDEDAVLGEGLDAYVLVPNLEVDWGTEGLQDRETEMHPSPRHAVESPEPVDDARRAPLYDHDAAARDEEGHGGDGEDEQRVEDRSGRHDAAPSESRLARSAVRHPCSRSFSFMGITSQRFCTQRAVDLGEPRRLEPLGAAYRQRAPSINSMALHRFDGFDGRRASVLVGLHDATGGAKERAMPTLSSLAPVPILTALFADQPTAQRAVAALATRGYPRHLVSMVVQVRRRMVEKRVPRSPSFQGARGAGIGATLGAFSGALAATSIEQPSWGGPILSFATTVLYALAGLGAGTLVGALAGGLLGVGIAAGHARIRDPVDPRFLGGVLLTVQPRTSFDSTSILGAWRALGARHVAS